METFGMPLSTFHTKLNLAYASGQRYATQELQRMLRLIDD